jgi:tetratricopeptide (TPR) repeat protein
MMAEPHYDEEALIALLEAGDDSLSRDSHIASCTACSKTLASVREIADCLKSPDVWDTTEISPDPNPNVLAFLDRAQTEMRAEDAAAEPWLRELLAQPREAWAPTLHAHPEWRTAGMVRRLIGATDRAIETMPPDAVEITALAVDIAEALPPARYGDSTVLRLRGHAWRERAYALYFTGAYNEAVRAVERSRKAFAECGYSEFDDARAGVVLALICASEEKFGEGLAATRAAAEVFEHYGVRAKLVAARRTEAIILFQLRRYRAALALYEALQSEPLLGEERAALSQNIALCHRELGNFDAAGRYFVDAIESCTKLGLLTYIAKTRWHLGHVLLAQGRHAEALVLLKQVRDEFASAHMANDIAEVTTDIAHALVLNGRMDEVAAECRLALNYFASAGLTATEPALSAIALLHESAVCRRLDETVLTQIRSTVVASRESGPRLYAHG